MLEIRSQPPERKCEDKEVFYRSCTFVKTVRKIVLIAELDARISIYPGKFGHVTVRPSVCTIGVPLLNLTLSTYCGSL